MIGTSGNLAEAFAERAARLNVRVHTVDAPGVPDTVLSIAREVQAGSLALASGVPEREPTVRLADEAGLRLVEPADLWVDRRADLGVSVAQMAIAETGSLVVHSTSEDRGVELCVDVHALVVGLDDLRPSMDDGLRLIRDIAAAPPNYVSLITGPSRTADIELVPSIGVHGAREIHVILVRAS